MSSLEIVELESLPEGRGLATPLHPKRRRVLPPRPVLPPPPPLSPPAPSPRPAVPSPSPSVASSGVPSPGMYVEWIGSEGIPIPPLASPASPASTAHIPPRPRPRQTSDFGIDGLVNLGSDDDSGESDGDDCTAFVPISRVFYTSLFDTPLDAEDEDTPAAADDIAADAAVVAAADADDYAAADAGDDVVEVPPTATDQPRNFYDFEWRRLSTDSNDPQSRREPFSQSNVGPTTPRDDPYDIFVDIWDRQFMEYIATETNKYAQEVAAQLLASNNLYPRSRIGRWIDTTADELYVLFGIILAMGVVVKSRMEEYWSATPDIFYTPGFSAHMTIDRFLLLCRCLHFNDNMAMRAPGLGVSEARLYKIQPVLSHLNMKFQTLYNLRQDIALDESLLMWKGWLDMSQLIPNKVANRGIKTYEICESQTGYLWRFEVHAHKRQTPSRQVEDPLAASTPSIVLRLVQGLEHKGYTLWMDNFYNSPCLARRLKSLGFDCVGTLRTDRMFVPQTLHSLTKQNMRKGQVSGLTSGDVDVMVWRDNNRIAMISTYHGVAPQAYGGSTKPTMVLDYNIMMGGVDKKDQLLAMYPIERKRTRVWYKKLFRRLLNVSVLNSYIIYNHHSSITHRNFRLKLISSLLSKHRLPSPMPPVATSRKQRIDITHRFSMYPAQLEAKGHRTRRTRRQCVMCKTLVSSYCVGCNKPVCMDSCFISLHK